MKKSESVNFSEQIRKRAVQTYIAPARQSGRTHISISVRELMGKCPEFAKGRQSIFCSALIARPFLRQQHLELVKDKTEGPPMMRGTNVVYHYNLQPIAEPKREAPIETKEAARIAERLLAPLRGLLAHEIAAHGGVDGYMRWVRSDAPTA